MFNNRIILVIAFSMGLSACSKKEFVPDHVDNKELTDSHIKEMSEEQFRQFNFKILKCGIDSREAGYNDKSRKLDGLSSWILYARFHEGENNYAFMRQEGETSQDHDSRIDSINISDLEKAYIFENIAATYKSVFEYQKIYSDPLEDEYLRESIMRSKALGVSRTDLAKQNFAKNCL